jgi:hypothetical protein
MQPRLSWSSLVPGLIAVVLILVGTAVVLMFAGVGRIHGKTVRLHVVTTQARGLMKGSDVWLDGQKVGTVHGIDFRTPSMDSLGPVVIAIDVRQEAAELLRRDAPVELRTGTSFIGPVVVYLGTGSPVSPRVAEGDTLRAAPQTDVQAITARLGDAKKEFTPLMADARTVVGRLRDPNGTVGALMTRGAPREMASLEANVGRLRQQLFGARTGPGPGTVMAHARTALARVDSVRVLLGSPDNSYGRLRRDSTLIAEIGAIADELSALAARLETSEGTASRLRSDSALVRSVTEARREMTLLFADMRRRPLRYIAF